MGLAYLNVGRIEESWHYLMRDLEIAERFAASEPDRVDYQMDLVDSLLLVGTVESSPRRFQRALAILLHLKAAGVLMPKDESKIEYVARALRTISAPRE